MNNHCSLLIAHCSLTTLSTLLIIALFLFSCSDAENEGQINREYLESGEYQAFAEDTRRESERRKDSAVRSRLMSLPDCTGVRDLTLPLAIDERELEELLSRSTECPALETSTDTETEIMLLGRLSDSSPESWLIMLEPASVYKNRELAVATAADGKLSDFEKVALYQEDLSREVTTELQIEQKERIHITAVSHRVISYPIEQESEEEFRFVIGNDGSIEKE